MVQEVKRGFENLECPVKHWDAWHVFLTLQKLDSGTREEWEKNLGEAQELPTFKELVMFLETHVRALETAHASEVTPKQPHTTQGQARRIPK